MIIRTVKEEKNNKKTVDLVTKYGTTRITGTHEEIHEEAEKLFIIDK